MISPQDIKSQAEKWWKPFLQSHLSGTQFFPKTIERIGKVSASSVRENINELQNQLDALRSQSKETIGYGYTILYANMNFRRAGNHSLPQAISFETADGYIDYIERRSEWNAFLKNQVLIDHELPQLKDLVLNNPVCLIDFDGHWPDLIKVCKYFITNPKPDLYLRQLPIDLHTKFIEQKESIIKDLLDHLIADHRRDTSAKTISNRFYLKYDEPSVRIRILDHSLLIGGLGDIAIPRTDFERLNISCKNILVAENKINFLSLPVLPHTIAIWSGGGFMISNLKNTAWMHEKNIFYWGDLDTHGFAILHQMRSYFPQTVSVMMDTQTFNLFKDQGLVEGKPINVENLSSISDVEREMFTILKSNNLRLEQEKIRQEFSDDLLKKIIV